MTEQERKAAHAAWIYILKPYFEAVGRDSIYFRARELQHTLTLVAIALPSADNFAVRCDPSLMEKFDDYEKLLGVSKSANIELPVCLTLYGEGAGQPLIAQITNHGLNWYY